ncbi:D-alanyl-D-alanine carboxypeptidase [Anaerorhabdus furcosa]|uniref:D-alanyl-D-alanine carboxypeptidase n=2 Tax=Anaerorhabdus furcosa TaxID=118967 RepID=A0A1T4ML31_9FIRM|nr:D-alanyl-D-alanine carboxypeptidase [Anaerorhabdus furcosa]
MIKMKRRIFSYLICGLLIVGSLLPGYAEDNATPTPEPTPSQSVDTLGLNAKSAVLIDAKTGMVLYQKNMDQQMFPASITKILTNYIALEKLGKDDLLTASATAIDNIDRSSSHIWLDYGEQAPVIDLVYASIMQSANDASNVLAEAVGGTQEDFAKLMNEVAKNAGAKNSNFTNAHGLPDDAHVTTAYDMAMITRAALRNENFKEVFGQVRYDMAPTNKQKDTRVFSSANEMIKNSKFKYDYATGGKTGWTEVAGYTMVNSATKDNMDLIGVVMGCDNADSRYEDMTKLFNYGFDNYKTVTISNDIGDVHSEVKDGSKVIGEVDFTLSNSLNVLLPMSTDESTLAIEVELRNEDEGEAIQGYAIIKIGENRIGEVQLEKNIILYDLSFGAYVLPKIVQVINWISIGILGLFLVLKVLVFLKKNTKLPE